MSTAPIDTPYLTAAEAAAYLRYPSTHWFLVSVRKLGIPCIQRGRRRFFTREQLDQFMSSANEASIPRKAKKGRAA